jgi:hypothetical protein
MVRHLISALIAKLLLLVFLLILVCSCEQVIEVNLKDEASIVVIESFITNKEHPVMVKITQSQAFFNQSDFQPVEKASVLLEMPSFTDKLVDKGGGYYVSSKSKGVSGRSYSLKITSSGKLFSATVTVPVAIPIDTVYFQPGIFRKDSLNVFIEFRDQALNTNYYRIRLYRNGRYAVNDYYLITDAFSDGVKIVAPVYYHYFAPKDTVEVELQNLERNTWKYLKGISESVQQGVNSQAPGNPPTNITGGALGVFGAYGSSSQIVIAPQITGK